MAGYARGHDLVRVGLIATVSLATFGATFGAWTSRSLNASHADLFVRIPSAEGLQQGDAVLLRGVQVGEVRGLAFDAAGAVLIRTRLTWRVELGDSAYAELIAADMFGRKSLVLQPGKGATRLADGDTLPAPPPASLTDRIAGISTQVERVLGDTTVTGVHGALHGLGATMAEITMLAAEGREMVGVQSRELSAALREVTRLSANVADAAAPAELAPLRSNLDAAAANLVTATARMDTASAVLAGVLRQLEHGDGTAARLLRDPLLYDRIVATLTSSEALLTDLRRNPKRYINISVF